VARPLGLVGVMSTRRAGGYPFPEGGYFRGLMRAGRRLGIKVIVFSPLDIDWASGTVPGYTHNGSGWRVRRYPVPRVVYDRIFPSRGSWQLYWNSVGRMRRTFHVRFMGRGLRGKWQFHRIARRFEDLREHIPETRMITGTGIVLRMLAKHGIVYIKPVFGSGGKGIVRIVRRGAMYSVQFSGRGGRRMVSAAGLSALLAGTRRRYVVQQGLDLNYLAGSPYDVRSIVQKNGEGKWQVTGKAARIGRRHSITSNLHTGGYARTVPAVLQRYFPDRAEEIEQEIDRLAIRVAEVMEQKAGPLCDLGLDMGVDRQGKVWLLEVNSKPGRRVFRHTGDRQARWLSVATPMAYARYLLEQRSRGRKST
jgi:glutathione synthase/RimK-type ligase-like ATP-grasp enzyme